VISRMGDPVVLYVMGYGRSGSTIIGNILGEIPGFVHLGELRSLWSLGILGGRVCGCGTPIKDCPFWKEILTTAFVGPDPMPAPEHILEWQREAVRLRTTPRLLRLQPGQPKGSGALEHFAGVASRIYRAAATVSESNVIVDTSKHIPDAALLHLLEGVQPYFVHLVRDPRAVTFSWRREMASPGEGRASQMPRHGAVISARGWMFSNLGAELVRRRSHPDRSMMIRYEDFASSPRATIDQILALIGHDPVGTPFVDPTTVELGPNHTAGGNPSRLRTGRTKIRIDEEWHASQGKADRLLTTALTLPLLKRYGYPLRPGRSRN
jgi:sulfotransferase family protein